MGEGAPELRTVIQRVALSSLDLGVFGYQVVADAYVLNDRRALPLDTEAGLALTVSANAEIGNESLHRH